MILAIDPGVTTGFCNEKYESRVYNTYQINFAEKEGSSHLKLYNHLSEVNPSTIIYEAFHWRQGQPNAVFTGVEYIGIILLWTELHRRMVYRINPSDGKGFWNDKKIKALGLWVPGCPHGMDALRLLLTYKMKEDRVWKSQTIERLRNAD